MAGFRPGLGLGGTIHSLVVMDTFGISWGGGVGSGLITEAIDILLIRALDGDAIGGEFEYEFGRMDTGGRPFAFEWVKCGWMGGGWERLGVGVVEIVG